MGRLIRRDGTGSVGTIQRSNEADTEELRSGVVVASGNAGRLVTTGGGRTAPQRLKTISQQEAKRQKQIQQARVDLLDQALERQRRQDLSSGTIRNPADFTGEKSAPRSGSFGGSGQGKRSDVGFTGERVSGQPDWGEIAKGVVLQGADQAATGITSTLSMLEGAVMKPVGTLLGNDQLYESGPFHTLNDYMQEAKEANEEHFTPEYKKAGRVGEVLGDFGPSVVAAIPQAALAFLTAGTSAAAQGTTAGVQAAGQVARGASVARTFLGAMRNTAQNPQFWYSVLSTAGNEYEQAKAEGADDGRAYAYAALTGLLNSVVEASGGIDTLTPDNKRILRQWVDTMLDEGREEVIQGAVSRLAQNAVYGQGNPLFSLENENAVVNPSTAAREFLGGAVVGGILGGGQLAVQQGLNAAANRQAARRAQEGVQAAQGNMGPVTQGTVQEDARGQENAASPGETATLVERVRRSIPNLEDMGPVAEVTGNEMPSGGKVVDRLVKFVNSIGNRVNRPGFGDVLFSKGRIKSSMLGHGYGNAKVETFAAVPSVIRNGVQIDHQQDWKGRGYDTYTFAAPVNYRGKRTYLGVIVTKNVQDGRYYVHEVVDENGSTIFRGNENTEPASDGRASLSGTVDTVASSVSSAPIINQAEQDVNQESVVHTAREGESRDAPETVKTGLSARGGDTGSSGASPITSVAQEGGTVNADLEERFQALLAAEGADSTQAAIGGQLLARAAAGEELNATQEALVSAMPGGGALLEAAERTARRRQEAAPAQAARQVENTETAETARRLESALGRTIRLYDGSTGQGARSRANGYYEDGTIYVNSRSQNPTAQIIAHELTHSLEGAESYGSLRRAVLEQIRRQGVDLEALREQKWNLYAREGAALAEEAQVDAEIVAEYVEKNLLTDEESILDLVRRDRSLGEQIRAFLDRVLARLGNEAARERAFLRQARGLYARALEETRQSGQREQVRQERDALREAYARGEISEEDFDAGLDAVLEQEGLLGEEMLDSGDRYSFGGENAREADLEALDRAREMARQDVAADVIFRETGWYQGADGKWRFEIDDSNMRYEQRGDLGFRARNADYDRYRQLTNKAERFMLGQSMEWLTDGEQAELTDLQRTYGETFRREGRISPEALPTTRLEDYLDHEELYRQYPQLRDATLLFDDLPGPTRGQFDRQRNAITLDESLRHAPEDTLVHEIQHAIQQAEGFAGGASPEYWEQVQRGNNAVGAYDRRIETAHRQAMDILDRVPADVAERFREWYNMDRQDPEAAMRLAEDLDNGPYSEEFNDYFLATWTIDDLSRSNYLRQADDLYRNTAGEIEARDAAARRQMTAEVRRQTMPDVGNNLTVFSDSDGARYSISEDSEGQEQAEAAFQAMPVKAQTYLRGVERRLVNQVGQLLSVPRRAQREFLRDIASEISSEYLRRGTVSQETTDRLFERAYQEGVKADQAFAEEYDDLRRFLRDRRLTISPDDTADIPDFEQWRRAHFGRLNVGTRGDPNVDQIYQELSHNWSELFPAELTHPADQLQRIGEVAEDFRRVEKSLDEYYGREAETFKAWAKNDFQAVIDGVVGELRTVRRYVEEAKSRSQARAAAQEQAQASTEEIAQVWRDLKSARRGYERVAAKNLLTDHDQVQVGRLLKGEIEPEHLDPRRDNVRGITAVYEAKREYERLAGQLRQWNRARKSQLLAEADRLLDTANDWKDKSKGILYSRETMERNIRDIVPDKELAEEIIRTYFTPVHQGAAAANRMKNQYRDQVRELGLSRKVAEGDTVSEAHAVQLLGEAEDNIRYLEQSRGRVKARDGKTLEEWRAVVRDLWEENPGLDQEKIRDAVSRFRSIYDDLFQQMNEVRVRNGYEPVNYRQGYFPHFQPGEGDGIMAQFGKALGIKTEVTALPTTINGLTHTFRPGIRWFGNAQERLGFNTAYDAVEGFDRYIEGVADVIHQTDNIQRLRALATQARYRTGDEGIRQQVDRVLQDPTLSDTDRQNRIEKIYEDGRFALSNFVVELDEYTNLLANKKSRADRTMEQNLGRDMYNLVKALEGRVAANMVAINPASWLTNFIPITQGWGTVDSRSLLGGMWDTLRAYREDDGFVGRSTFLTNRRGSDPLVQTWAQRASATASRPMEYIDNFTADTLVRARYNQNIRRGLSETAAMEEADAWAAGVMADRSKGATPTLFNRSNPLTKALTQFQLEVNNQLSYLYKDLPRDVKDRGLAALAGALVKFFLGAFLYDEVYEFFIGRRPALDPIGILNDTVGDLTGTELPNLVELGMGAIAGDVPSFQVEQTGLTEAGVNLAESLAEELPFIGGLLGGGRIPLSSAMPDVGGLWNAATNEEWSTARRLQEVRDELLEKPVTYLAMPFGGGQVKRAAEGIEAVVRGGSYSVNSDGEEILQYPVYSETLPEQVRDAAYASIFGKSSFSTARDWVESGFKSLSAKETDAYQEMTAAGVDGETAFGLIQELKGASSADKLSIAVEAGLDDEAAIAAAGLILGKDLTTEAGNPTRYAMLLNAVDTGLAATEGLDLIQRGIDLEDYLELTGEGMEPETAKEVVVAMQDLEAETERVSKLQQYTAIADLPMAEADKESALALVMSDSAYEKYQSARSAGVSTEDYVWFLSATDGLEADKDENGKSISGSRKTKVLRVIDRMDLNRSQKDALFLAAGYSESTLGDAPWR